MWEAYPVGPPGWSERFVCAAADRDKESSQPDRHREVDLEISAPVKCLGPVHASGKACGDGTGAIFRKAGVPFLTIPDLENGGGASARGGLLFSRATRSGLLTKGRPKAIRSTNPVRRAAAAICLVNPPHQITAW